MSQRDIRTLTLRELEASVKGPIWVLNRTKENDKGEIIFTVPKLNGSGSDSVTIPVTFLPVELTQQVSKKQLLESSEFRRALNMQIICAISEEDAEELLKVPGAKRELQRLSVEMQTGDISSQVVTVNLKNESNDKEAEAEVEVVSPRIGGVLASIYNLFAEGEELDDLGLINTLKNLGEDLTTQDYDFVVGKAQKINLRKTIKYCERKISELNG